MIQLFDIKTGALLPDDNAPRVTILAVVVQGECGRYTQTITPDELPDFEATHHVLDCTERRVIDPAYLRARREAYNQVCRTSCRMPPVEDLKLRLAAKATAPEDYASINPDAARWPETREFVRRIKNAKMNYMLRH